MSSARRKVRVTTIRKRFAERERQELERIKERLRRVAEAPKRPGGPIFGRQPSIALCGPEARILLRALNDEARDGGAGGPDRLSGAHEMLACHYRWELANGNKKEGAERICAAAWGVSTSAVRKYATKYKATAEEWVKKTLDDCRADPELHQAVRQILESRGTTFKALG